MQLDPHLAFLGSPKGNVFLQEGRQSAALWLRNSQTGCPLGKECEDGRMRIQVRRRFRGEGTADTLCTSESGLRASEVREGSDLGSGWSFCPLWSFLEGGSISRPWRFTQEGSWDMLQATRIFSDQQLRSVGSLQDVSYGTTAKQGSKDGTQGRLPLF